MKQVIWSAHAKTDLENAVAYRAKDSVRAAELLDAAIRKTVSGLAEFNSGKLGRIAGTFEKIVRRQSYIVLFETDDTVVRVLRIIHGARHWPPDTWPPS